MSVEPVITAYCYNGFKSNLVQMGLPYLNTHRSTHTHCETTKGRTANVGFCTLLYKEASSTSLSLLSTVSCAKLMFKQYLLYNVMNCNQVSKLTTTKSINQSQICEWIFFLRDYIKQFKPSQIGFLMKIFVRTKIER